MRILHLTLLGGALLALTAPALAAAAGKPVVTNKTRFRIPYRSDALELQRLGAREIRLYVSVDHGSSWQLAQTVAPESGRFEFQTPGDGEYWFAVRTVDAQNMLHPGGSVLEPGLMVIVDSITPRLELTLQQVSPGKVQLAWSASDANLDPTTLRLEYVQSGSSEWQQVSVIPRNSGQTTWSVPQGGLVAVRGSVGDLAGNTGRAQNQVSVDPSGQGGPGFSTPELRQPVAMQAQPELAQRPAIEQFPNFPTAPATPSRPEPATVPTPSDNTHPGAVPPAITPQPAAIGQLISDAPQARPEITRNPYTPEPNSAAAPKPSGRERVVGSRKFQIAYKIDDVGPSGVSVVEIYITQDNGQKWWKYGEDSDRNSPCDIEVPQDGMYGFALRVRSGVGLGEDPPTPGMQPEILVSVDQTAPRVELLPVQQGQGSASNQLMIRWRLTDENPAKEPVALYYSANRNGPWEPIGTGHADSGSYLWTVGSGIPSQVYVRVEARDAAGNTGRAETAQPVVIDLARPSARIVDIEPNGNGWPK